MGTFALAVCYVGAFVRPKTVQTACSMVTDFSSSRVFLGFFAFSLAFGYQYFISPPRERPRVGSLAAGGQNAATDGAAGEHSPIGTRGRVQSGDCGPSRHVTEFGAKVAQALCAV